jgi:hypothetical protein
MHTRQETAKSGTVRARLARWIAGCAVIGGALMSTPAAANNLSLIVNGKAIHTDTLSGVQFNEKNWGAGFQLDFDPVDKYWVPFVTASEFKDSNKNPSYYMGGGTFRRFYFGNEPQGLHTGIGVIGFLMKREGFENNDWFPGILPAFTVGNERIAINATYIPKVDPKMVPLWFFQLRISIYQK